ncbi:MAG: hypothetical protein U0Y10_12030 [Spirosomataceae bacterium]
MRLLTVIGLLTLLLFNMLGHYPVYMGMEWSARKEMEQRLDAQDVEGQELFEVKIPMNLPYWQNMKDYERVNGRFEHNGEFYTMFKQKVQDDTLHLVCVKDREQKKLFQRLTQVVQLAFGDSQGTHQKAAKFLENLIKDYLPLPSSLVATVVWMQESDQPTVPSYAMAPYVTSISSFSPPPEV